MEEIALAAFALFILVLRAAAHDAVGDDNAAVAERRTMFGRSRFDRASRFDDDAIGAGFLFGSIASGGASSMFSDHSDTSPSINPATGLPMMGGFDMGGNGYGCCWSSFDSFDSGIGGGSSFGGGFGGSSWD